MRAAIKLFVRIVPLVPVVLVVPLVPVVPVVQSPPVPWSSERPLTWKDFAGKPDIRLPTSSMTVYMFSYEENCVDDAFTFKVTTVFQPDRSWVKPSVMRSMASQMRLLAHEQGHFDMGEVSARRLRRTLRELKNACGLSEGQRQAIVKKSIQEDVDRQAKYDFETSFSNDEASQARWLSQIERDLKALAAFSDTSR